eukprot:6314546-Prorocentrum_lima.AAC.1
MDNINGSTGEITNPTAQTRSSTRRWKRCGHVCDKNDRKKMARAGEQADSLQTRSTNTFQ